MTLMNNPNILKNELARWNQIIRDRPNEPQAYVRRGMVNFKLAKIDESIADFDRAELLAPRLLPYLWQRGLSYYYAERFEEGAKQFEVDLTVNAQDVEETVWRYLYRSREREHQMNELDSHPMLFSIILRVQLPRSY
jgi:tetratricopeptide (TPR) repeat protein